MPGPEGASDECAPVLFEGYLDAVQHAELRGWAWFADQADPASIEVRAGQRVLGSTLADNYREDLYKAGKRGGECAFALTLEGPIEAGLQVEVYACLGDCCCLLSGGVVNLDVGGGETSTGPAGANRNDDQLDVLPVALNALPGIVGFLDEFGNNGKVRGWVADDEDISHIPTLEFVEDDVVKFRVTANEWRPDLAELREGEGCCGFKGRVPESLCDGRPHLIDIRIAGREGSVVHRPLLVRPQPYEPDALSREIGKVGRKSLVPLVREHPKPGLKLTVVVVFYNMQREAQRTLTSLSQSYQIGMDDLEYEVLCVDNGSAEPLTEDWVSSFGPQFRLVRPSKALPSPCFAINEAARQARGEYIAIMIDGAHVLTPGVFLEAMAAFREEPEAVVAVRHWFMGGDQRWLSVTGYTREQEDRLFHRIRWPNDGYKLFLVGAPITESADPWFDWLNESNCLMLPTATFAAIGGMDEAFSVPGAGFANLDLMRRAEAAARDKLICLIGEASFHQFHEGTTTNVSDDDKDVRVRSYAMQYRHLRGHEFKGIDRNRLRFRGSLRNDGAIAIRQRPLMALGLSVTSDVRPGSIPDHFDEGAQAYLQSCYAECGLHQHTRWLDHEVELAPADLINLQNIIGECRPTRIVLTGDDPGLLVYLDSILALNGLHDALILQVLPGQPRETPLSRVRVISGSQTAEDTLLAVERHLGTEESVLVLFRPEAQDNVPVDALSAYSRFVSFRSYLIFMGSVMGQPWLGYSNHWYRIAIREFARKHLDFAIDPSWERHMITSCPSGYLRRVRGAITMNTYDPALNQIESL